MGKEPPFGMIIGQTWVRYICYSHQVLGSFKFMTLPLFLMLSGMVNGSCLQQGLRMQSPYKLSYLLLQFHRLKREVIPICGGFNLVGLLINFRLKITWDRLRTSSAEIVWHDVIWFKEEVPRCSFVAWMSMLGRLPTRDRLISWGLSVPANCVLCANGIFSLAVLTPLLRKVYLCSSFGPSSCGQRDLAISGTVLIAG